MKPVDFRNETFADIRKRVEQDRRHVAEAWRLHGPGTTRDVARRAGIDILSFRPRSTELYQVGFLACDGQVGDGHQGFYRARTIEEWEIWCAARRAATIGAQLSLPLSILHSPFSTPH